MNGLISPDFRSWMSISWSKVRICGRCYEAKGFLLESQDHCIDPIKQLDFWESVRAAINGREIQYYLHAFSISSKDNFWRSSKRGLPLCRPWQAWDFTILDETITIKETWRIWIILVAHPRSCLLKQCWKRSRLLLPQATRMSKISAKIFAFLLITSLFFILPISRQHS